MSIPSEYLDQIITGDGLQLLANIPDKSIDLLVTDPPYFMPAQTYPGSRKNGAYRRTLADMSISEHFYHDVFLEIDRVLKPDGTAYVFCDAQSYPLFYITMFPFFRSVKMLVWDKINFLLGYTWRHQYELIVWASRIDNIQIPSGDGDILRHKVVPLDDREHTVQKPIALLRKLINKHKDARIVLDPFIGSGSTALAALLEHRHFVGFEIDHAVAEVARERVRGVRLPLFAIEPEQLEIAL